jgi:hypothetical protein
VGAGCWQEDELRRAAEEKLRKEEEEASKWMNLITLETSGTGASSLWVLGSPACSVCARARVLCCAVLCCAVPRCTVMCSAVRRLLGQMLLKACVALARLRHCNAFAKGSVRERCADPMELHPLPTSYHASPPSRTHPPSLPPSHAARLLAHPLAHRVMRFSIAAAYLSCFSTDVFVPWALQKRRSRRRARRGCCSVLSPTFRYPL